MTDLHTDTVLAGRYRLGALLGRGGSADVYRSTDETLGREIAVKLLRDAGEDELARHRGEITALARLNHPNLVALYDAGTDDGRAWFVMELIEGQSLAQRLTDGPLPLVEAASIGCELADGLAYVHAEGVVHRDLKPGNVLLGTRGQVKLTDFGIALVAGEARVTRTGLTVGTAAYLSPEQVQGAHSDDRADVYSLGLVLLEAITGQRAYSGSTVEAALARLNRQPEIPSTVPPAWRELLGAMTARDSKDRPSATEVASRLRALPTDDSGLARTATLPARDEPRTSVFSTTEAARDADVPVARRGRRLPLTARIAAGVVGVLVLVAIVLAVVLAGDGSGTPEQNPATSVSPNPDIPPDLQQDLQRLERTVQP